MTHIINSSVLSSEKEKSIKSALETEELCDMAFVVPHSTRHQMVYGYP